MCTNLGEVWYHVIWSMIKIKVWLIYVCHVKFFFFFLRKSFIPIQIARTTMKSIKKNRKINLLRLNVMDDIEINSTLEEENHIRHVPQAYNMFMEVSFGFCCTHWLLYPFGNHKILKLAYFILLENINLWHFFLDNNFLT